MSGISRSKDAERRDKESIGTGEDTRPRQGAWKPSESWR